jgi:hypothetical protein
MTPMCENVTEWIILKVHKAYPEIHNYAVVENMYFSCGHMNDVYNVIILYTIFFKLKDENSLPYTRVSACLY